MIHPFTKPVDHIPLPRQFTYPFHYTPHLLCTLAAGEVKTYLETRKQWKEELHLGKMFGVLVVQNSHGAIGFLAAFSGNLDGKNSHEYFVPPIYDLLQPDGFFKTEEENISAINLQIEQMEKSKSYLDCKQKLKEETSQAETELADAKVCLKEAKAARNLRRQADPDETDQAAMIRESQFQKAEYKRLERHWQNRIATLKAEVEIFDTRIEVLKTERKSRSAALQRKLFEQFQILNYRGETKDLCTIFEQAAQKLPPAGAGECAAPKLLQYAYLNRLKPIALAEFWWGDSPKAEIRRHGYYYPACKSKCEPILQYMLQGLDVEPDPLLVNSDNIAEPEILFEDSWLLVINKPAGMLSVPGKGNKNSVYQWLKARYPEATGPMIVHRLDMATSGVLIIAKTKEVHRKLQDQFKNHTVEKQYWALLDGIIVRDAGTIDLPLCPDLSDRPRQMVSTEFGKPAITEFKIIGWTKGQTHISFRPLTGRTHQLRVHAAHPLGLNAPISGDELYGKKAERLYLHATQIEFEHPVSGKRISIRKEADF